MVYDEILFFIPLVLSIGWSLLTLYLYRWPPIMIIIIQSTTKINQINFHFFRSYCLASIILIFKIIGQLSIIFSEIGLTFANIW